MAEERAGNGKGAGGRKGGDKRRFFRNKKRSRKGPGGEAEGRQSSGEASYPQPRRTGAPTSEDRAQYERRERRRRRRLKAKQKPYLDNRAAPAIEPPEPEETTLKAAFIYTHVIRPSVRDSFDFRTEHFSKVSRRLEDFKIDLSSLFEPEESGSDGPRLKSSIGPMQPASDDADKSFAELPDERLPNGGFGDLEETGFRDSPLDHSEYEDSAFEDNDL
jgi:hypothetical protein